MGDRAGATVSVIACLSFLVVLVWPYAVQTVPHVNTYYRRGLLSPLFAGVLVLGVVLVYAAAREDLVSDPLATGATLALGAVTVVVTVAWAVTARVDLFRAPGWAMPAHRFVLVGLSLVVLFGAAWHTWSNGLLTSGLDWTDQKAS